MSSPSGSPPVSSVSLPEELTNLPLLPTSDSPPPSPPSSPSKKGESLGEGFICPVCNYKCLSPEALHTHYEVEHPFAGSTSSGSKRPAHMVVAPIYSTCQEHQLSVLSTFSYFWVSVAIHRNLPNDVKPIIFSYCRADSYGDYLNFRSSEEFSKGLWPSFRAR